MTSTPKRAAATEVEKATSITTVWVRGSSRMCRRRRRAHTCLRPIATGCRSLERSVWYKTRVELWFLIWLAVGGFVVGALARLAVPGPDPMPWWATILLGVGGVLVGGLLSEAFLGSTPGLLFSLLGAVLLLIAYRRLVQKRPLTGPAARRVP